MANYMARYLAYAPLTAETTGEDGSSNTYGTGAFLGKHRKATIKANVAEAAVAGDDNSKAVYIKEFIDADVELESTRLAFADYAALFGSTVSGTSGGETETRKSTDSPATVGIGFCYGEIDDNNTKHFYMVWLNKCVFSLPSETFETKGNSISFATPTFSGKASADAADEWYTRKEYATMAAAKAALKEQANIE